MPRSTYGFVGCHVATEPTFFCGSLPKKQSGIILFLASIFPSITRAGAIEPVQFDAMAEKGLCPSGT